jgi:uncharacterized OsmC-like protein
MDRQETELSEHIKTSVENAIEYLTANPDEARYTDGAATARIEEGLRVKVEGTNGETLVTDMPKGIGGGDAAPSPGWYLRAAMASCDAALIAIRAAHQGVTLTNLEVSVESRSDDRGILGIEKDIPAGPLSSRVHVKISGDADADKLREIVEWGHFHCPVTDAVKREVPIALEIEST